MAEVVYDGVGTPVNEPEITGAEWNLGATAGAIFPPGGAQLGGINMVLNNPNVFISGAIGAPVNSGG
jgi:hypothetical protein